MIHYSCDRCKREMGSGELRYVVRLDVQSAVEDAEDQDDQSDRDYLAELHDALERADDIDGLLDEDPGQHQRFDLCRNCLEKFIRDPLGCDPAIQLNFSQN